VKSVTSKFGAKDQSVSSTELSPLDVVSFVKSEPKKVDSAADIIAGIDD
jgi:hypothetical protein